MKELVALLKKRQLTIASIESVSAGLFASKMAEVSGASKVLKGALVTYQTICKEEVLHLDKTLMQQYGVISKEVADAMALQGKKMFQSDICVSFTGNAGPEVMDHKEVGLVHMAIAYKDKVHSLVEVFHGSRNEIREQAVNHLAKMLIKEIEF